MFGAWAAAVTGHDASSSPSIRRWWRWRWLEAERRRKGKQTAVGQFHQRYMEAGWRRLKVTYFVVVGRA